MERNEQAHNTTTDIPATQSGDIKQPDTTDAENSLSLILSIYWSFLWRSVVIGLLILLVSSFILGFVLAMFDKVELAETLGGIATIVIAIAVGIRALGAALNKKHKGYSIIFIKKKAP